LAWKIEYTRTAESQLKKLDRKIARRILDYMDSRVATLDNPRTLGKALSGRLGELWRYRVGDCRVICEIRDGSLCILVVKLGNRREVYR
jgi:mRNA interferase RelE/StbE